ncbi:hypothetical protein [Deinococcus aestuarii]|uniref:hypothetical protein n=1 Tax=Deinococcus aestuarii TaxID=2774531 RepID=UPI001C0A95E0|nr:hypothetical protein [Deinococcus aestuarii]
MPKRMWLALALTCGGGTGAITVREIPALPLSRSAAANSTHDPVYPSGYRRSQLEAAREALETLPGWTILGLDEAEGRVLIGLNFEAQRAQAGRRLRARGLPVDIAHISILPVLTLPPRTTLAHPHQAELSGPATLIAGEAGQWTLRLTNTGREGLHLEYGACDLAFEVRRADDDETVRPAPTPSVCTAELRILDLAPGRTGDVLSFSWNGSGPDGQPLPPGPYLLRAAFDNRVFVIRPPDLRVNLTR